jgi:hypothetical protein
MKKLVGCSIFYIMKNIIILIFLMILSSCSITINTYSKEKEFKYISTPKVFYPEVITNPNDLKVRIPIQKLNGEYNIIEGFGKVSKSILEPR